MLVAIVVRLSGVKAMRFVPDDDCVEVCGEIADPAALSL